MTAAFITPAAVAEDLQVSLDTVYRWCRTGFLPATRIGTKRNAPVRISRADYDRWLNSQPAASA